MSRFIKVRNTLIDIADIESVVDSKYRDRDGVIKDQVVVKLKNGNTYSFPIDSSDDVKEFVGDIYRQICRQIN